MRNAIVRIMTAAAFCLSTASFLEAGELKGSGRTPHNTMLVKIDKGGDGPMTERVVLSLDKAAIIELPADARDVIVPNPEIVDVVIRTSRRTFIMGKAVGQTNAFFLDASGRQILNLEIRVERDLTDLAELLRSYLPNARIKTRSINDNIVLSGFVASLAESNQAHNIATRYLGGDDAAARVLNMLTVEGNEQVLLKVRVVEMQRTTLKQFGVDASTLFDAGEGVAIGMATMNPYSIAGNSLANGLFSGSYTGSTGSVSALLQMMERVGVVRTLAEPNLTAVSGEAAKFLAGGEFPVPVGRDRDGNITIKFKPFGVGLGFTPVVLSEGRISLRISTEVSELTNDGAFSLRSTRAIDDDGNIVTLEGATIPALKVRRAETTVEMPSGGSLVMAGLIQETTKQSIDGIPGIKDIPVLGALFRSRDYQRNETELVVIVTPILVNSVSEAELKTPIDHSAMASDLDTILMGRLTAVYGINRGVDHTNNAPAWDGPVGYIVD